MNVYLPIEVLNREFQSKLLIAMESASRGLSVYMGDLIPYLKRDFFVPGIILHKSVAPSLTRIKELNYYKNKKFIVTSLDEEVGLFELDRYDYIKLRYSEETIKLTDKIFTWGKFDYKNLCGRFKKQKKKFILSGNPRLDFWTKKFDFFFKKKKLQFNNYILFSHNFTSMGSKKEFNKFLNFLKESNYINRGYSIKEATKQRNDSFRMFEKFSELIEELSKKTDLKIIVRPHPTENMDNYKFLSKLNNVTVTKKGSISEWIYYSKAVVHSSCTGGLEASIRGKPTISYLPFKSSHGHKFTDNFSVKTKTLSECLKKIKNIENNKIKIRKFNLESIKFRANNFNSNKASYEIIVDEFVKSMKFNKLYYKNNDFLLNLKFKLRDIRSKILGFKYGNVKFTTFNKEDTIKTFEIFKQLHPKYNDLKINFMKKNIIQIKN